jgi:hypothetical protein
VFLAMIGQHWLTAADQWGQRRLDDPEDFVRLELEEALARPDVRVIPVLVQDVEMPTKEQLPKSLQELALRHGHELREVSWRYDVDRLIQVLRKIEPGGDGRRRHPRRRLDPKYIAIGLSAALLVGAAILGVFLLRDGDATADRLVFGENGRLYTVAVDGSDEQPLTGTGLDHQPDWSHDGTQLAVARDGDIVVLDEAGKKQRDVTEGDAVDDAPSWYRDGRIAFDRVQSPGSRRTDVWVVDADGSATNLTPGSRTGGQPDWSPDGERIAFQRLGAMFLMDADGNGEEPVTLDVAGSVHEPAWSPTRDEIAFALTTRTGTDAGIYIYSMANESARRLRRTTKPSFPSWSIDGNRLTFVDAAGIWTITRNGGTLNNLRKGETLEAPSWRPADR